MKTMILLKNGSNKKCVENIFLSSGTNNSISNFRETIPLKGSFWITYTGNFFCIFGCFNTIWTEHWKRFKRQDFLENCVVWVTIDMRIVSRPSPPRFPLCPDCVPFELVLSAVLLWRESCGGGGQITRISVSDHHNIKEALPIVHESTGSRGVGGDAV
jgi:hypothetical protein